MKRLILILFCTSLCCCIFGQTTKIRGTVLSAEDGKGIPFAAVYFEGTKVGTTADIDGNFSLNVRDTTLHFLTASMLTYVSETQTVNPGAFNNVIFLLRPQDNTLNTITVKPDNKKAKRLLAAIDAARSRNNPEDRPGYECDVYSKMELDLTHPREQLRSKTIKRQWSFIFDYIDTSEVSGVPYLPVMINETIARRYHCKNPDSTYEKIIASRMSGADPSGTLLTQFTGSMHLKNNFYSPYVNVFNVDIPSPINADGMLFYNYFIIDSLEVDARKTLLVRFHPKKEISTPSFDGEMMIDATDFALRRVKARMVRGQNMNWVRDLMIETSYQRTPDSLWFYKSERFYSDFSVSMADSSKLISVIGNRTLEFSNPSFGKVNGDIKNSVVVLDDNASMRDDSYWNSARPYELSAKERDIYNMVDKIQDTPLYTTLYDIVYAIINGYYDIGPVGIGPYLKIFSYNPLEGFRLRLGARTSVQLSKKDRFGAYLAYGFRDKKFKGGATWEHLFSKTPTRKLTVDAHHDVLQLGRGTNQFNDGNILASVMGAGKTQKLCPVAEASVLYDHEFFSDINTLYSAMYRQYFANAFVPMRTPGMQSISSITSATACAQLRYSREETVIRGHFVKTYTHTNYPVFTLSLTGGSAMMLPIAGASVPAQTSRPFAYFRPELSMDWKVRIPPVGMSKIHLTGGAIVGKVPYPMLHLHEGNGTYLLDKSSFSTMDFFEFASDSWATLMWDHNFYGFFLGKIPLIKKLQLREAITLKVAWGHLSKKNDGVIAADGTPLGGQSQAMLLFPHGMHAMGKVPLVEAGFAITNIFRLFRIDFVWRVTHRNDPRPAPRNFVVNFGIEFKF